MIYHRFHSREDIVKIVLSFAKKDSTETTLKVFLL